MTHVLWSDFPLVLEDEVAGNMRRETTACERTVYPIGNGRLGGTVFGEPRRERIQFNEDSLWVGNEDCTGGYQPFGDIHVDIPHEEYVDYRRELDIGRAVQTVTYASGGVRHRREFFSSYPAQVMVFRFTAEAPGSLSGRVRMTNRHEIPVVVEDDTLVMAGDTSNFWFWRFHLEHPERIIASREYASDKNIDLALEARVRVLNEGGSVRADGGGIAFDGCDAITILLAADTNYLNRRDKGWPALRPARTRPGGDAAGRRGLADAQARRGLRGTRGRRT